MQPFIPPTTIKDLSDVVFGGIPVTRTYTENDPESFHPSRTLEPDPVFMGFRALVTTGPIGRLKSWIEQKVEEREDRRFGGSGTHPHIHPVDRPGGTTVEDPRDRDIAA